MSIRLKYLSIKEMRNSEREPKAQPCMVAPDNRNPYRVVPITPLIQSTLNHDCLGCVGEHNPEDHNGAQVTCSDLPDCGTVIYVRATPANKLKYVTWLLSKN
jgi:hypothetical protein